LNYNTFENQFLVWAIKQIILKINRILHHIKKTFLGNSQKVPTNINKELLLLTKYKTRLLGRLNDQYLRDISDFNSQLHFSTVLTMAPGYKDFYKCFLLLQRGLDVSAKELFELDLKDVSLLYEYWCFLKIVNTLRESDKYRLDDNDFIKIEHNKFVVDLKKGRKSRVSFTKKDTKENISVFYNKEFSASDYVTYTQKPDNFIEFKKEGYKTPFWYIFDAKYRFDNGNQSDYPTTMIQNGPPQETIGQMHRYRDAILERRPEIQTYRSAIKSLGGIILFPFPGDEGVFADHPFYKSIKTVNIGALPLHPGHENRLFRKFLDELFSCSPESIFENVIDYDKEEYTKLIDDIKTPVLIAFVPNDEHYEKRMIFHSEQLTYHIKFVKKYDLNSIQNIFQVKHLALYSQRERAIVGYSKIQEIKYVTAEELVAFGAAWEHRAAEYLTFKLDLITKCERRYSGMKQGARRYTNYFCLKEFVHKERDEGILNLNNYEIIRMWKEIINIDSQCKTKRKELKLTGSLGDVSAVSLSFTYQGCDYECLQDAKQRDLFYLNGRTYRFSQNLLEFLNA
jgi:hypothetical protein